MLYPEGDRSVFDSTVEFPGKHLLSFEVDSWNLGASRPPSRRTFRFASVFAMSHDISRLKHPSKKYGWVPSFANSAVTTLPNGNRFSTVEANMLSALPGTESSASALTLGSFVAAAIAAKDPISRP